MIEDDCLPWTLPCEIWPGLIFLCQMRRWGGATAPRRHVLLPGARGSARRRGGSFEK